MACFLVPTTEAIITTIATHAWKAKEAKSGPSVPQSTAPAAGKLPFSAKLKWLSNLLWGGSALLAFEHVWHGEVVPWFPFLTAASDPASTAAMLQEMATTGVTMAALVTAVWGCMVGVTNVLEKHTAGPEPAK